MHKITCFVFCLKNKGIQVLPDELKTYEDEFDLRRTEKNKM